MSSSGPICTQKAKNTSCVYKGFELPESAIKFPERPSERAFRPPKSPPQDWYDAPHSVPRKGFLMTTEYLTLSCLREVH